MRRLPGFFNLVEARNELKERRSEEYDASTYEQSTPSGIPAEDRAAANFEWDFRVFVEDIQHLHLFDGKSDPVSMTANRIFLARLGFIPEAYMVVFDEPFNWKSFWGFIEQLSGRWEFVDDFTGCIVKRHLFFGILPSKKTLLANDADKILSNYSGYTVLIDKPEFERNFAEFLKLSPEAFVDDGAQVPHQNILDCFQKAYPNGKGAASWSEVQQKVGYSRRSIVRAQKERALGK